jgi:hypothetical protein
MLHLPHRMCLVFLYDTPNKKEWLPRLDNGHNASPHEIGPEFFNIIQIAFIIRSQKERSLERN